jgi:hypothetical protein
MVQDNGKYTKKSKGNEIAGLIELGPALEQFIPNQAQEFAIGRVHIDFGNRNRVKELSEYAVGNARNFGRHQQFNRFAGSRIKLGKNDAAIDALAAFVRTFKAAFGAFHF